MYRFAAVHAPSKKNMINNVIFFIATIERFRLFYNIVIFATIFSIYCNINRRVCQKNGDICGRIISEGNISLNLFQAFDERSDGFMYPLGVFSQQDAMAVKVK